MKFPGAFLGRCLDGMRGLFPPGPAPAIRALKSYRKEWLAGDLRAGVNVALLAFPQGMAYAMIAGLPIRYGIICYIAASLVTPWLAASRFNSYAPTNATAVLIFGGFMAARIPAHEIPAYVPLLGLMVAVFLVLGALLNFSRAIQFISRTVITAYITAAALLIIANQVRNVVGVHIGPTDSFVGIVWYTAEALGDTHLPSLGLACVTAGIFAGVRRWLRGWPNVALTLLIATGVGLLMRHFGYPVDTLDDIALAGWQGFPEGIGLERLHQLAGLALALTLLIMLEANSIGKTLAARAGDRLDLNREIMAMGIGNLASALAGGMPASASLTQSTLYYNSGARTPLGKVAAAVLVAVLLFGFLPYIGHVPRPALAVLVIIIGCSLFRRHQVRVVSHATGSDAAVFFTTLGASLFLGLDTAIYLGAALSIALFLRKAAQPELVRYGVDSIGPRSDGGDAPEPHVSIVHVEGALFFGAADIFYEQMRRVCEDKQLKIVILKLRYAMHIDATSILALQELLAFMRSQNRVLLISDIRPPTLNVFQRSGFIDDIGKENLFPDDPVRPNRATADAVRYARTLLGGKQPQVEVLVGTEAGKKDAALK